MVDSPASPDQNHAAGAEHRRILDRSGDVVVDLDGLDILRSDAVEVPIDHADAVQIYGHGTWTERQAGAPPADHSGFARQPVLQPHPGDAPKEVGDHRRIDALDLLRGEVRPCPLPGPSEEPGLLEVAGADGHLDRLELDRARRHGHREFDGPSGLYDECRRARGIAQARKPDFGHARLYVPQGEPPLLIAAGPPTWLAQDRDVHVRNRLLSGPGHLPFDSPLGQPISDIVLVQEHDEVRVSGNLQ